MKKEKRELLIGAVGLIKGSIRHSGRAMVQVCDDLESVFEETGFLKDAPFDTVSVIFRFGDNWGKPKLGRINQRHKELECSIEMPMKELRIMDEPELVAAMRKSTCEILIAVGADYALDVSKWRNMLDIES